MKRSERRLLEEKLRYVAMEDIELDPQREQQMLDAVKADFLRQSAEADMKRSRGHGIGRRVLIASAAAVLLIVLSFGYTVLMPESVTHAKGFMRTAAIWVNNTFHLGYEFEEPMENNANSYEQEAVYSTLEEAAANIPYPLVCLTAPNFEIQSIIARNIDRFIQITLIYSHSSQNYSITLSPSSDDISTMLLSDAASSVPWSSGELVVWESDSKFYAITFYSGMEISIIGTDILYNDFLKLCQSLEPVN